MPSQASVSGTVDEAFWQAPPNSCPRLKGLQLWGWPPRHLCKHAGGHTGLTEVARVSGDPGWHQGRSCAWPSYPSKSPRASAPSRDWQVFCLRTVYSQVGEATGGAVGTAQETELQENSITCAERTLARPAIRILFVHLLGRAVVISPREVTQAQTQ